MHPVAPLFLPFLCIANVDFKPGPYYASFEIGDTTATVSVNITDENIADPVEIEDDESFHCFLNISDELVSKGVQVDPSAASTTITIRDNDGMQVTMVYAKH